MNRELVDQRQIEALAETFRKRGWDARIPSVISGWGEFKCDNESFRLIIEDKKRNWLVTQVKLWPSSYQSPDILHLEVIYGGKDYVYPYLKIGIWPVKSISLIDPEKQGEVGAEPRLLIGCDLNNFWACLGRDGQFYPYVPPKSE